MGIDQQQIVGMACGDGNAVAGMQGVARIIDDDRARPFEDDSAFVVVVTVRIETGRLGIGDRVADELASDVVARNWIFRSRTEPSA